MLVFIRLASIRLFKGILIDRNFPFNPNSKSFGILSPEFVEIFQQREKYLSMPLEMKRQQYKNEFLKLEDIETWDALCKRDGDRLKILLKDYFKDQSCEGQFPVNELLNSKVSVVREDITSLEVDAIVNSANNSLLRGAQYIKPLPVKVKNHDSLNQDSDTENDPSSDQDKTVDGAIHKAAGPDLLKECRILHGCKTGEAKITAGYFLPAKYVIHTVGPRGENPELLSSCYNKCLEAAVNENIRSIAFPCISTGNHGYPQDAAAVVALKVVRLFLETNHNDLDRVIFCTFLQEDLSIYESLLQLFFPTE